MKDFTVRKANTGDADAIYALEQECFSHPWSLNSVVEELENENACLFVAESGGSVVGYAGVQIAADEGYITNVAVTASMRKRGVGRLLLAAMCSMARERRLSFITLEMRETNLAAAALYTACGFENVGRRRGYYTDPREDAILMTLYFGERT